MTAETEVRNEVSQVTKAEIVEDKCGLDMSSYQDLPNGNGIKHVSEDNDHHLANGSSRDDQEDNSYVFVNGVNTDDPVVEKKDLNSKADSNLNAVFPESKVQVGEFTHCENPEIVQTAGEEENGLGEVTLDSGVSAGGASLGEEYGDGVDMVRSDKSGEENGKGTVPAGELANHVAPESPPKPKESLQSQIDDLDSAGEVGESELMSSGDVDSSDVKEKSDEFSIAEVGEHQGAQGVVLEASESELTKVVEVNSHLRSELQSAKEVHESGKSEMVIASTDEGKSSEVESGKTERKDQKKMDSDIVALESEKSDIVVTDNVQSDLNQGIEAQKSTSMVDFPVEKEMVTDSLEDVSEVSPTTEEKQGKDGIQKEPELIGSSSRAECSSSANSVELQSENACVPVQSGETVPIDAKQETVLEDTDVKSRASEISPPTNSEKPEMITQNGPIGASSVSNCPSDDASLQTEILSGSVEPTRNVLPVEHHDICAESSPDVKTETEAKKSFVPTSKNVPNDDVTSAKFDIDNTSAKCNKDVSGHDVAVSTECDIEQMPAPSSGDVPSDDAALSAEFAVENTCAISKGDVRSNDVAVSAKCESKDSPASGGGDPPRNDVAATATSKIDTSSGISNRDISSSDTGLSESKVLEASAVDDKDVLDSDAVNEDVENAGDPTNTGVGTADEKCQDKENKEAIHGDGISISLPEISNADAVDTEMVKRPFRYLVRIPRCDDEKLREKIRHAQLLVEEKTQVREAVRVEIQNRRASCHSHNDVWEAAKSEERAARSSVKLKRQEIDSVQSVINRVKNAISVEDIDARIYNLQHMIEHETLPLKEEKQFIREIKQLKHLREQLSSNMGSQDEVQQALNQRDQIEECLKCLKKELDGLKGKVSKAETASAAARKKIEEERKKLRELQAQFRAADDVRQEAYVQLQNLRKELFEKNELFWMYRDDAKAARDYDLSGDTDALHRLCLNQVESILELWNNNAEFKAEYVRCNMMRTLRRLGTLDGRSLGPNEEPPVLSSYVEDKANKLISSSSKVESVSYIAEKEKHVASTKIELRHGKPIDKVAEQISQTGRAKTPPRSSSSLATVSGRDETESKKEQEHVLTKEEQELARKAEESRKEEAAAKLREQRCLEEKVKAQEALERKKRNAEKAQIRAELRAQKEAEQKEKEREKKMRKKERKKAAATEINDGTTDGEISPPSDYPVKTNKENEIKETPTTVHKKHKNPSLFTKQVKAKSIPPPLRNRGKKRLQQWMWIIFAVLLFGALFLLGNIGFFSRLGPRKMVH